MQPAGKKHILRGVVLTGLLAALCIGLCELAFCRVADPELYHTVVDPVTDALGEACRQAGEDFTALSLEVGARLDAVSRRAEERALARAVSGGADAERAPLPALRPASSPRAASLVREGDRELLLGGSVPVVYYNQADPAWAGQYFGRDRIGSAGCGPAAMAMAVSSLTGEAVDPAEMAAAVVSAGCWAPRNGSSLSIVPTIARQYGLNCAPLPVDDAGALEEALSGGGMAVALMGPGRFTQGGHFILLHGLTPDGKVLAADPNSRINSLTPWDPELILDELSPKRGSGAPLWLLTAPRA